jgi:hypothetical protein
MFHPNVWSRVQESPVSGGRLPFVKGFLCGLVVLGLLFGVLPVRLHESCWLICYGGGPGMGGPQCVHMRVERCRRI